MGAVPRVDMTLIRLVEDDPSIGPGLVRTLAAEGHDVAWARTVAEAVDLAGDPSLLLDGVRPIHADTRGTPGGRQQAGRRCIR